MGFAFNVRKDNVTPPEVFNWRLFWVIFVAAAGSVIFGYDLAFIGGVFSLPSFIRRFELRGQDAGAIQAHMVNTCKSAANTAPSVAAANASRSVRSPRRRVFRRHDALLLQRAVRSTSGLDCSRLGLQHRRGDADGLWRQHTCVLHWKICQWAWNWRHDLCHSSIPFRVCPGGRQRWHSWMRDAPVTVPGNRFTDSLHQFEIGVQVGTITGFWINYGVERQVSYSRPKLHLFNGIAHRILTGFASGRSSVVYPNRLPIYSSLATHHWPTIPP